METKTNVGGARRWLSLATLCVAVFMSLLDVTIVNVALPTIQKSFNESFSDVQWIINAYTLAYAVVLLVASKLGDIFGRKRIFFIELTIFTLGSLASALSTTGLQLNLFRTIQGIGGAGIMGLSMTIVASTFVGRDRGLAFGIWSSVIGVATAMGPLLGGYLIQLFNWRAIFMINVPIGVIALLGAIYFVDESYGNRHGSIDWIGMLISIAMVFSLVFGLVQKETHSAWHWSNVHVAGYLIAGIVLLIVFILLERHLKSPMIDLAIFKSISFDGTIIAAFCLGAGLYAFFTYLTIWMQDYLGYSAMQTGVRQLAISIFSMILGPIAGMLSGRWQKRWMISGGLLLIGCGFLIIYHAVSLKVMYIDFVAGFALLGIGNAIVNPPLSSAAMDSVKMSQVGMASGVMNVFRQLGISFGVVIYGLRLSHIYDPAVTTNIKAISQLPQQAVAGITKGLHQAGPMAGHSVVEGAKRFTAHYVNGSEVLRQMNKAVFSAFNQGYKGVLVTAITLVVVGAIAAGLMIKEPHHAQK